MADQPEASSATTQITNLRNAAFRSARTAGFEPRAFAVTVPNDDGPLHVRMLLTLDDDLVAQVAMLDENLLAQLAMLDNTDARQQRTDEITDALEKRLRDGDGFL